MWSLNLMHFQSRPLPIIRDIGAPSEPISLPNTYQTTKRVLAEQISVVKILNPYLYFKSKQSNN